MQLQGQTALVIGAASPAGTAIARALHAAGARLCLADTAPPAALAQDLSALALPLDPCDDTAFAQLAYAAGDALGDIDILVIAIAPAQPPRAMAETPPPDFDHLLALHTRPLYLATRHFLPAMQARGRGTVLTCAPLPGSGAAAPHGWHGPARAWVIAATESLAAAAAPQGLRVNAILPVTDDSPAVPSFMRTATAPARQQALSAVPLGRFAAPADIGAAAVFLCSDAAAFLTGVILPVDGGHRL